MVENVEPITVKVWMLSFIYPHAFVVKGEDWNGVQVWDMVNGIQTRHILEHEKHLDKVHSNGRFLTISEFNNEWADSMCLVAVYDVQELIDTTIATKDLWENHLYYSPGGYAEQINAASNTTSLVVSHASTISILNFWKDRIITPK